MKRDILKIDEALCNGCGECVPNCHEGALKVIDGKVRLLDELMCDGLGACIGHCPQGAITIETRESQPYNERKVMEKMTGKGKNIIIAHMKHLKDHSEKVYLREGVEFLRENAGNLGFNIDEILTEVHNHGRIEQNQGAHSHDHASGGCPGSRAMTIERPDDIAVATVGRDQRSELRQWPVQMHLINPNASYLIGADLLLAADCVAYASGNFHNSYLKGRALAIACPKLDRGTDIYIEKLISMIDFARINTITVMMMEVPCCGGLLQMVRTAVSKSDRKVPVKQIILSISGDILAEEWV